MIKYYYQIVLDSVGDSYQDAEQQLIAQGSAAVPFLQEQLPKEGAFPTSHHASRAGMDQPEPDI